MAASLLHDLGHWPFCHPIEDMALDDLPSHEEFAAEFLSGDREIAQVLRSEWRLEPSEVLDVLTATTDSPAFRLVRSILSGPIDIDKMDYLDRDSLHAGVPYGRNFDRNRLIQSLLVNANGDGLAINAKGKTAAEMMVFARYIMFSEVYWHHAVRSATCMFGRGFFGLYRHLDLRTFFQQSEAETIEELRRAAKGTDCEVLLEGVFGPKRHLFKRVVEFSHGQARDAYESLAQRPYVFLARCAEHLAERASRELGEPLRRTEILIDAPPPHREVEFRVDIYFPKEGVYRPLEQVSPVVEALAHRQFDDYVKRVRIFAHPNYARRLTAWPGFAACLNAAIAQTAEEFR
jgi:HD superfamily phosphohydrolase